MARLTEEMVIARSKQSDLSAIKKLNCWGAGLGDVSLLRRMPNVEVLALSINKIRTLCDFAGCRRLRELYVRKNEIGDLAEIRHLRGLPDLAGLWLEENPCARRPDYRMTVLRNLPNLEKLDNVQVQPDEVQEAMRRGAYFPDSDDEGYPRQDGYGFSFGARRSQRSPESSPERERDPPRPDQGSDGSEAGGEAAAAGASTSSDAPQGPPSPMRRSDSDERYDPPAMSRSHYEEYALAGTGEGRFAASGAGGRASPFDNYFEKPDRSDSYQQMPRCAEPWEQLERNTPRERFAEREREREYPSAVMAEHRGFTRRPVARNSNLLSAVLCLVKELDYPSLEVAEMAVRCRMDELATDQ